MGVLGSGKNTNAFKGDGLTPIVSRGRKIVKNCAERSDATPLEDDTQAPIRRNMELLGRAVARRRKYLNITRPELAQMLNVSGDWLMRFELGHISPTEISEAFLVALSKTINVELYAIRTLLTLGQPSVEPAQG